MCDTVDSAALVARNEWKLLAVMVTVSQYLIVEGGIKTADVRGEEVARERDYSQWLLRLCSCSQRSDFLATAPPRDGGLETGPVTGDALRSHESRPH